MLWQIMTLCSTSSLNCLSATCRRLCEAAADVLLKRCLKFAILGPTPNGNAQRALGLYAQDPERRIHGMPTYTHCADPDRAAWWNKRCGAWVFGFGWQRDADQRSLGRPIWATLHQTYDIKLPAPPDGGTIPLPSQVVQSSWLVWNHGQWQWEDADELRCLYGRALDHEVAQAPAFVAIHGRTPPGCATLPQVWAKRPELVNGYPSYANVRWGGGGSWTSSWILWFNERSWKAGNCSAGGGGVAEYGKRIVGTNWCSAYLHVEMASFSPTQVSPAHTCACAYAHARMHIYTCARGDGLALAHAGQVGRVVDSPPYAPWIPPREEDAHAAATDAVELLGLLDHVQEVSVASPGRSAQVGGLCVSSVVSRYNLPTSVQQKQRRRWQSRSAIHGRA